MRWNIFLGLILLLVISIISSSSVESAVIYGGKLYTGQNFTTNLGGNFRVYGTDQYSYTDNTTEIKELRFRKAAIVSDVDESVSVTNGTCVSTNIYKYCYLGSYLDLDNPLTYRSGKVESSMSITVETLPPATTLIDITRPSLINAYCGQLITIPLSIRNNGTFATNITYIETLPDNAIVVNSNGASVTNNVLTVTDRLTYNESGNYTFTITNFDCKSKNWNAKYSFTTYNSTINRNITNLTITMMDFYNLTENLTPSKANRPSDDINYTLNFTNTHPSQVLYLDLQIDSDGLVALKSSNGVSKNGNIYKYSNFVSIGGSTNIVITFNSLNYSNSVIKNKFAIKVTDRVFDYNSTHYASIVPGEVLADLEVTNINNKSMRVDVYAQNNDVTEKYYYIYGTLKGFDDTEEPIYSNGITPNNRSIIGSKTYDVEGLNKTVNMSFTGIYRDKNSVEHKLSASRIVKITSKGILVEVKKDPVLPSQSSSKNTTDSSNITEIPKNTPSTTSSTGISEETDNKDFITKVIEGFSNFLQSIFS